MRTTNYLKSLLLAAALLVGGSSAWAYELPEGMEVKKVFYGTLNNDGTVSPETFTNVQAADIKDQWDVSQLYSNTVGTFAIAEVEEVAKPEVGESVTEGVVPTYVSGNTLRISQRGSTDVNKYAIYTLDTRVSKGILVFSTDIFLSGSGSNNTADGPRLAFLDSDGNNVFAFGFNSGDNSQRFSYSIGDGSTQNANSIPATTPRTYIGWGINELSVNLTTGDLKIVIDYITDEKVRTQQTLNLNIGTGKNIGKFQFGRKGRSSVDANTHLDNLALYTVGEENKEAGVTTINADIDFSSAIEDGSIAGTVNQMTIGTGGAESIIQDGWLRLGDHTNKVTIDEKQRAGERDVVKISFDMAWGNKNGMGSGFNLKDAEDKALASFRYARWGGGTNTLEIDMTNLVGAHNGNKAVPANATHFDVTVNYAAKTITSVLQFGNTTKTFVSALSNTKPLATFEVFGYNAGGNADRASLFDNLKISTTTGDYSIVTAQYTVKFVCNGEEIKDAETREGDVDDTVLLLASDKSTFFNEDETKRYIYESDNASQSVIVEDGTTVATVTFREAEKYSYTITSSYENTLLDYTTSGEVWEDLNKVSIQFPKYFAVGRTLVIAPLESNGSPTKTITVNNDDYTNNIEYSSTDITDLYLLAEAENLGTNLAKSATSFSGRVSGKQIIYGASGNLITLPAGKYKFTLGVVGKPNSGTCIYNVSAGENVIITDLASGGNFLTLGTSDEFELSTPTPISFTCSNANSDRGIDLIYIQKTDKMPEKEEVNVTAAGYATLASNYALDLSEMENIYTANVADGIVNFSQNNGKVLPGTGLLIKAPQGKVEIPIISEAATVTDNALVGVLADTKLDAGIFVLMNGDQGVGFYKAVNENGFTVRANSAYLPASVAAARFIGLDSTATGISDASRLMNNEKMKKEMYNLQGQRVAGAQPKKGLYIKEGRKVIIK